MRAARGAVAAAVGVAALAVLVVLVVVALTGDEGGPRASRLALPTRPAVAPFAGYTETDVGVGERCLRVVVADTDAERVRGLRARSALGPYDGMLFVFGGPSDELFTMAGVPVPLDIGFYDGDGAPVSRRRMQPCADAEPLCPVYEAEGRFDYALETLGGDLPSGPMSPCQ